MCEKPGLFRAACQFYGAVFRVAFKAWLVCLAFALIAAAVVRMAGA